MITSPEKASPSSVRLGMRARACLMLGAQCRRLFQFQLPDDLLDPSYLAAYFDEEADRARTFLDKFTEKPDLGGRVVLEIGCGFGGMLYALSEMGCARVIGVDTDAARISYAEKRLREVASTSASVGDAATLALPSESVDVVVSDAVIEHIGDLHAALREISRVLRPGGRVYVKWGPSWLTYNGPHLLKCIGVPWVHLLFSDRTILNVLYYLREHGPYPRNYIDYKIDDFQNMGRNTRRRFRAAAASSGLAIVQDESRSPRRWKQGLSKLPLLDELLAGELVAILERRDSIARPVPRESTA